MNKSGFSPLMLTLLNVSKVQLNKRWNYDNVRSPFTRIYLITSGAGTVYHNHVEYQLEPGFIYLIPPYTYSRYKCEDFMEQYYVHFFEGASGGLSVFQQFQVSYQLPASQYDQHIFDQLLKLHPNRGLIKDDPKAYDNRTVLLRFSELNKDLSPAHAMQTHSFLQLLLSRFIADEPRHGLQNSPQHQRLAETVSYILENLDQPLSVNDLATRIYIHPDYFSRLFQEFTGVRPSIFILNKRIERAQLLLSTTNDAIKTVADATGFANVTYFNRLFKQVTHKTPSAYRTENWLG